MSTRHVAHQPRRKGGPPLPAAPLAEEPGSDAAAEASLAISREDRVRHRAYALDERRGCEPGHAMEDWLQAEAEVDHRSADT